MLEQLIDKHCELEKLRAEGIHVKPEVQKAFRAGIGRALEWIPFDIAHPTDYLEGEQFHILMTGEDWGTWRAGLYTRVTSTDLRANLAYYDWESDKFYDWATRLPTHWMFSPEWRVK